ncbi:uncharacterized protein LOC123551103 [Mercenaria mercenaria]|uniref:uncharacterized protein LOC123551103 n=1 Tax=Mercenaria mercenaria TaxID=6596 RepID=UPI00234F85D6|nr:uncharacterized protein LOC123551103 [Mercenaria mercenaria]
MSSEWFKNMCGASLDDEAMQRVPNPKLELTTHVTIKTIQSFGLLGTILVGPIAAAAKKETRNWPGVKHKITRCGRGGLFLGVVMGPVITYMKIRSEEDSYKIWDRCYRLRYNRGQVLVDQASVIGGVGGAAVGAATSSGALFGGLVGMSSGILAAAIVNNTMKKEK